VGGYIFSSRRLNLDDRVELATAQAYRRVGRRTQKVDFRWLRGVLPSDPLVIIDGGAGSQVQGDEVVLAWNVWHMSGGVALDLNVTTDPPLGPAVGPIKDLPGAGVTRSSGRLAINLTALRASVELAGVDGGQAGQFWLVVRYSDEWGCEWESRQRVSVLLEPPVHFPVDTEREPVLIPRATTASTAEFRRRIVSLPSKRLASPT
jgi:hypothetical protein